MGSTVISLQVKRLEQAVVSISAKVADVIETAQQEKALPAHSEATLIQAQLELEELYSQLNPLLSDA